VPAPATLNLVTIKAPPSDHVEPLYSSVHATIDAVAFPPTSNQVMLTIQKEDHYHILVFGGN